MKILPLFGILVPPEVAMASMSVSLPDQIRDWVQSRVDDGTYSSASDYLSELIRRDQSEFLNREQLLASLDEAIARGLADADAGLGRDLDEVCDELEAKYTRMIEKRGAA